MSFPRSFFTSVLSHSFPYRTVTYLFHLFYLMTHFTFALISSHIVGSFNCSTPLGTGPNPYKVCIVGSSFFSEFYTFKPYSSSSVCHDYFSVNSLVTDSVACHIFFYAQNSRTTYNLQHLPLFLSALGNFWFDHPEPPSNCRTTKLLQKTKNLLLSLFF